MMFLLWIIGWIALQTGLHRTIIAFALLILSSTKTYSGDIVFITDGIQIFEWFLFFSSIALAIKAIHTNNALYVIASLFTSILCIFTKEESSILLVVSPIIVIFSFNPFNLNKKLQLLFIFYYLSIILCVLALIYFRHTFVAGAIEIKPIATALHGFLFTIVWSFSFVGLPIDSNEITKNFHVVAYQYGYPFSDMIWILWIFICNFYIWLFLFHANKKKLFEFSILIFLNFLSSLQGIVCFRTNVLYFSTMSFAFTFSFLVFNNYNYLKSPTCPLDKYKKSLFIFLSVISVIFIIIFSQIRSYYQIQDLNPNSINRVFSMYEWIYGARGEENPTIPTVRKEFIKKKFLEKYSLNKKYPPDQIKKYKEETFKSLNKNRNIKESSNEMFLPRVWFYSA